MSKHLLLALILLLVLAGTGYVLWADEPARQQPASTETEAVDAKQRLLALLDTTGDFNSLAAQIAAVRAHVEEMVQSANPSGSAALAPHLEEHFSQEAVRAAILTSFTTFSSAGGIESAEQWAQDPSVRAIHTALMMYQPDSGKPDADLQPSTRARLRRFVQATEIVDRIHASMSASVRLSAALLDAIDPLSSARYDLERNSSGVQPPREDQVLQMWVAPALKAIPDQDLDKYIAFAESRAGRRYFESLVIAAGLGSEEWTGGLIALTKEHARLQPPADAKEAASDLVAQARHLMHGVGTRTVMSEARSLLLRADKLRPDDAEIQTLLGEIASNMRPGPRPSRQELRTVVVPGTFDEAEAYLKRAIELDPTAARPYVLLGHAHFLKSEDDEAARMFDRATELDPNQPWLNVNRADLASARGEPEKAIPIYLAVLAQPEPEKGVHYWTLVRSRIAYENAGRLDEYTSIGTRFLADHPEHNDFRLAFGEHLLSVDADPDQIIDTVEKVGDRWHPAWKHALLAKALANKALRQLQADRVLSKEGREWLVRALGYVGGSEHQLVNDLCTTHPGSPAAAALVVQISEAPAEMANQVLSCAFFQQDNSVLEEMVKAGADLNAIKVQGIEDSPLAFAVMTRNAELFEQLLKLGADPKRPMRSGRTIRETLSMGMQGNQPLLAILARYELEATKSEE